MITEDGRAAKAPYGNVTYADPGYQADKVKRYPLDSEAHCRAAWSYINMPKNAAKYTSEQLSAIKGRIRSAAKKYGIQLSDSKSEADDFAEQVRSEGRSEEFTRAVVAEAELLDDGWTLEGYAAVFDAKARIRDDLGEFDEVIRHGAFAESVRTSPPVVMFEHGKHPLIGEMPLGRLTDIGEDSRGLHIRARLTDNWLIQPVRDAIRDGGVRGMSFRLKVPEGGERWSRPSGGRELRELLQINTRELGPVVFPAYKLTTAEVRSALDCIDCETGRPGTRSAGDGDPSRGARNGDALSQLDARTRERARAWNSRRQFIG